MQSSTIVCLLCHLFAQPRKDSQLIGWVIFSSFAAKRLANHFLLRHRLSLSLCQTYGHTEFVYEALWTENRLRKHQVGLPQCPSFLRRPHPAGTVEYPFHHFQYKSFLIFPKPLQLVVILWELVEPEV